MQQKVHFSSISLQNGSQYVLDQQLSKNQSGILKALKDRQRLIKAKSQFVKNQHLKAVNQIKNASPSEIKVSSKMNPKDYQILKEIVSKAFLYPNLEQRKTFENQQPDIVSFNESNKQLQLRISEKMKQLQDIELAIKNNQKQQDYLFSELETRQQKLKKILLEKGSLVEAEIISKQQGQYKLKISHNKSIAQNYNQKKINIVKNIISSLQSLNNIRKQYVKHLQNYKGNTFQEYKIEDIIQIIEQFTNGVAELNAIKSNSNTKQKQYFDSQVASPINYFDQNQDNQVRVHPFITKNSQTQRKNHIEQEFRVNGCKHRFQRSNTITPNNFINQYDSIDQIIKEYEQLVKQLSNWDIAVSNYFRQLQEQQNKQLRIVAIQKVYVKGVIGSLRYQIKGSLKQRAQTEIAIQKCNNYRKGLSDKIVQVRKVSQKIKNVEQTHLVFKQILQGYQTAPLKKKQLVRELQKFERQWQQQQKWSNKQQKSSKQFLFDRQNYRMKILLLDKQMQECARMADLQGYKKIKQQMDQIENKLKLIESQIQQRTLLLRKTRKSSDDFSRKQQIMNIINKYDYLNESQGKREQVNCEDDAKNFLRLIIRRLTYR